MIDQFVNFVIRPPRAEYNPDQYLWEIEFTLGGRKFKREDIELRNGRGHKLQCSYYLPAQIPENTSLPCVIYCHGNSGCRADANEAAVVLLPSNITLFTLDFSGSGLSDGEYVSLGWHEKDDLKVAISYLRSKKEISRIGLWGRSMGAVTSLLCGADDSSIAGMVLDSAFSNLFDLMMELANIYRIRLPKFAVKMGVQYMRHVIQKKAKFDIMDLNCIKVAPKCFMPALFGHATEDALVQSRHSDIIFKSYAGDKNIIKFEGDHNSARSQFYYDSVSIFFYNLLHPPQIPLSDINKFGKCHQMGNLSFGSDMKERFLYDIIAGLRMVEADAASSSSAHLWDVVHAKSIDELVSDCGNFSRGTNDKIASLLERRNLVIEMDGNDGIEELEIEMAHTCDQHGKISLRWYKDHISYDRLELMPSQQNANILRYMQLSNSIKNDNGDKQGEECYSYSSSNRESLGQCSSLDGMSDEESSSLDCTRSNDRKRQTVLRVLATPLRKLQSRRESRSDKEKDSAMVKKPKWDKVEKWEDLRKRLKSYLVKRMNSKRHHKS